MDNTEWPAEAYAIGSFIQSSIGAQYIEQLDIKPHDLVLDIGCGDGAFSKRIIELFKMASFTGIDASENMLKLASGLTKQYPHATFAKNNVMTMAYKEQFSYALSFWCLQWVPDIHAALQNIYQALKPGGRFLFILPAGDDAFITTYQSVKDEGIFQELDGFISPVDYSQFAHFNETAQLVPFTNIKVEKHPESLTLPSFDIFRTFVEGVSFYQGQIKPEIIPTIQNAMVEAYKKECLEKYDGKPIFNFSNYCITGFK